MNPEADSGSMLPSGFVSNLVVLIQTCSSVTSSTSTLSPRARIRIKLSLSAVS